MNFTRKYNVQPLISLTFLSSHVISAVSAAGIASQLWVRGGAAALESEALNGRS